MRIRAENEDQKKIWEKIVKYYEFIEGAQISNSLILLMALNESHEPLSIPGYLKKSLLAQVEKYSKYQAH